MPKGLHSVNGDQLKRSLFAGAALSVLLSGTAVAQIDEIIITAEKREQNLQEVPIAITAFSADTIQQQQISGVEDLQFKAPSLVYSNLNGYTLISLRGIGMDLTSIAGETAVSTFEDGVYQGQTFIAGTPTFDLERIEILRGPQGTLYGRNSVGGAINFITKKPSFEPEANLSFLYGNFNRIAIDGGVTGPIIGDKVAGRASIRYEDHDGRRTNLLTGEETDALNHVSGRAQLLFQPNDSWEVVIRGDITDRDFSNPRHVAGAVLQNPSGQTPATPLGLFSLPGFLLPPGVFGAGDIATLGAQSVGGFFGLTAPGTFTNPEETEDHVSDFANHRGRIDLWGVSGTVEWDVDAFTVRSITAYRDSTLGGNMEQDGSGAAILTLDPFEQNGQQFTQEINVFGSAFDEKFDWLLGGFYFNEDSDAEFNFFLPALGDIINLSANLDTNGDGLPPFDLSLPGVVPGVLVNVLGFADPVLGASFVDGLVPSRGYLGFFHEQKSTSWALFGQGTAHFTDDFRATFGLRYTQDKKEAIRSLHSNFVPVAALCDQAREEDEWDALTGTAGVDFDLSDESLLYGKVSRGYKAGGFNSGECAGSFDPETLWAYEAGIKSQLFGDQLQANIAGFFYDYTDIQFTSFIGNASTIRNAGGAELYGVELELIAAPEALPGFVLDGSVAYVKSEYDSFLFQDPFALSTQDIGGNALIRSPEWKTNFGAQYTCETGEIGALTLRGETSFSSKYYHDIFNGTAPGQSGTEEPSYTISNLRLIWQPANDAGWQIQGFVENLEDNLYAYSRAASGTTGTITGEFSPPRTYGVRLSAKFGG